MPRHLILVALVSLALAASAQGTVPAVPLLIPIHVQPTAGARGSLWVSELVVHNAHAFPMSLALYHNGCSELVVPTGSTTTLLDSFRAGPGDCPGFLLGVYDRSLNFGLRVRDVSRSDKSFGVELPAVYINNLVPSIRLQLLNVPVEKEYRYNLRLYSMSITEFSFRVRVLTEGKDELVADTNISLAACGKDVGRDDLGYAELNPLPDNLLAAHQGERVRIELVPTPAGFANWTWALLTITNNDTQEVTVVTPQYSP